MLIKVKGLVDEDFINYKTPSMFIIAPYCDFKCEKELGVSGICQNSVLYKADIIEIDTEELIQRYMQNKITNSIVLGGMEPFLWGETLKYLIEEIRLKTNDNVVIYTGYTEEEVQTNYRWVYNYSNIIIKFGRYIPGQIPHYDDILGVELASNNQYAKKIS